MKKDYYSVLARAVSALGPSAGPEARHDVYDRARDAIASAPLTASEIKQERLALEAAIRRMESGFAGALEERPAAPRLRVEPADERPASPSLRDEPPNESVVPVSTNERSGWSTRRIVDAVVSACAAAAILIAGFAAYDYWRSKKTAFEKRERGVPREVAPTRNTSTDTAASDESRSYFYKRQLVYYRSIYPAGTIVISKSQNHLYLIRPNTAAMRYTIAVGRECSDVVGLLFVSAKEDWTAQEQQAAKKDAARGVGQFGPRSLVLADTGHRIHGSEEPAAKRVIGCFPLVNDDVIDLYERVALGAKVVMN